MNCSGMLLDNINCKYMMWSGNFSHFGVCSFSSMKNASVRGKKIGLVRKPETEIFFARAKNVKRII